VLLGVCYHRESRAGTRQTHSRYVQHVRLSLLQPGLIVALPGPAGTGTNVPVTNATSCQICAVCEQLGSDLTALLPPCRLDDLPNSQGNHRALIVLRSAVFVISQAQSLFRPGPLHGGE